MKKLLGISLVAVLAATPLMAGAAVTDAAPTSFADNAAAADITAATASTGPKYQLMAGHDNDANAASAGYVKGAYNAAIKAVNAVDARVDTINTTMSGKQDALTAGDGIDISVVEDDTVIKVDLTSNDGLEIDDNDKLGIKDGDGIKTGANGVEVDLTTNGGLEIDSNHQLGVKAGNGITVDSTGVKLTNGIQNATDTTTYTGTGLTTQGYVDEAVAGINTNITNNLATKTGVDNTIKAVTIDVTDGHTLSKTTGSITVMTQWGSDDATTNGTTYGYLADADITGSVTAAINQGSVNYVTANTTTNP